MVKRRTDRELLLIEQVQQYPQLYNPKHKEYLNQVKKGPIWIAIATECGYESNFFVG